MHEIRVVENFKFEAKPFNLEVASVKWGHSDQNTANRVTEIPRQLGHHDAADRNLAAVKRNALSNETHSTPT